MKLYMAVTADEFELPLWIEEDYHKLAEWAGISPRTIQSAISRGTGGKYKGMRYIRVEVDEDCR